MVERFGKFIMTQSRFLLGHCTLKTLHRFNGGYTNFVCENDSLIFSRYGAFGDPGRLSPVKTFESDEKARIYIFKTSQQKERHYARVI